MNTSAIVMMVISIVMLWGGLLLSVLHDGVDPLPQNTVGAGSARCPSAECDGYPWIYTRS